MRVLVVSDNEVLNEELVEVLRGQGHDWRQARIASVSQLLVKTLAEYVPELAVVVLSPKPEEALAALREVRASVPRTVLAVGPAADSKLYVRALQAGADQYIVQEELKALFDAVLARLRTQNGFLTINTREGRLIAVLASSSGCGVSTVASNLAVAMAQNHKRCALLDLNLGGGDQASLFNLKPIHTLAELCANVDNMDRVMFEHSLTPHESGVYLLPATQSFSDIQQVIPRGVHKALALARSLFPCVVVDLSDFFHMEQMQTLREADRIVIVLRLDFTSLRHARQTLEYLAEMGINEEKVCLVVNRYGQSQELPVAKVEETLGKKLSHYLPDDSRTVNHANNAGIPAVTEAPSSKFSKSIVQLAVDLNEHHALCGQGLERRYS